MSFGSLLLSLGGVTMALLWRRRGPRTEQLPPPVAAGGGTSVDRARSRPAAAQFSAVVPTYNRGHVIGEAVDSVLAQRYGASEVIVVDDGSTDDTLARLQRRGHDPRVRVLSLPHRGVAAARNAGMAVATAPWISFLDSDDLWKPEKLEREAEFLARHPEVGAVFSDLEKIDGGEFVGSFMRTTDVFSRRLPAAPREDLVLSGREMYLCLLEEVPVKMPALTVRRDLLASVGGFNERWSSSEDWDLLLRLAPATRFGYIDRPLAVIRISPDSLHRLDQEQGDRRILQLLARHRGAATDPAAWAAARRGIRRRVRHLSWHYLDSNRRAASAATCLRGFLETGSLELLLRAGASLVRPSRRAA